MRLRILTRDLWTVLAVCSDDDRCAILEYAERLRRDDPREHRRLVRTVQGLAEGGPVHNERRLRALGHSIFEIKTTGGVRVLCFLDEGRVIVCDEAMRKPGQRALKRAVEHAARTRWRYLNDKRRGALTLLEDR